MSNPKRPCIYCNYIFYKPLEDKTPKICPNCNRINPPKILKK